jgi:hypothetical protein
MVTTRVTLAVRGVGTTPGDAAGEAAGDAAGEAAGVPCAAVDHPPQATATAPKINATTRQNRFIFNSPIRTVHRPLITHQGDTILAKNHFVSGSIRRVLGRSR